MAWIRGERGWVRGFASFGYAAGAGSDSGLVRCHIGLLEGYLKGLTAGIGVMWTGCLGVLCGSG